MCIPLPADFLPPMPSALPPEAEKAVRVRTMFDGIAARYDTLNRWLSLRLDQGWRRRTIREIGIGPGDVVLDLACGTGDLSALARAAGARAVGVDFARNMLRVAASRGVGAGLTQADATMLPIRSGSVSVVVCGFALRNFVSIPEVLYETARVLAPGGRLGLLEVDTPRGVMLKWGHAIYFRHLVPLLGGMVSDGRAYRYLPESVAYLPDEAALLDIVRAAGFARVTKHRLSLGVAQLVTGVRR